MCVEFRRITILGLNPRAQSRTNLHPMKIVSRYGRNNKSYTQDDERRACFVQLIDFVPKTRFRTTVTITRPPCHIPITNALRPKCTIMTAARNGTRRRCIIDKKLNASEVRPNTCERNVWCRITTNVAVKAGVTPAVFVR